MAVTKETKSKMLQGYVEMLSKASGLIVTEYRGMSMTHFNGIRLALRAAQGRYTVTKNTLFKIALHETGFAVPEDLLHGPTAIAVAYGDLGNLTKVMLAKAKEEERLTLKGAVMGQIVFRADQLEVFSTLPSLEQARASLIGTIQQPAALIVSLLTQPAQDLVGLLKAYTDKQQGEAA